LARLEKKVEKLSRRYQPIDITYVTITAYTPSTNECDNDPLHTAIMTKPRPGTIAVSRDLLEAGWTFGKRVWIKNHGVFVINDLMNKRYKKRIDIVMFDKNQAIQFGKRESVAVLIQKT
jgi:3D (Asp-Asp-Asp) domain-containing protein